MNKRVRRLAGVLAALLLFLQTAGAGALAADETYQIRIFAGNVGATVSGGTVLQLTGTYGENITFDPSWVTLPSDSPYYVRGVRKSGLDNNTVSNNVIHVTEDADYVVAYGIRGNLVSYTVNYVDQAGNVLAPSQTYYGNAGDKPVVAYLYVDDYLPQAYNLTRTLSENEAGNVFTFVYTEIVRPTPAPTPTSRPVTGPAATSVPATEPTAVPEPTAAPGAAAEPGAAAVPEPTAAPEENGPMTEPDVGAESAGETEPNAAPGPTAAAEENVPAAGNAGGEQTTEETAAPEPGTEAAAEPAGETAPEEDLEEEQVPLNEGPADLIDLDEEDTPLGKAPEAEKEKTDLQKDREQKRTKFYVAAGLLAAALAVIAAAVLVLLKKRGKQP